MQCPVRRLPFSSVDHIKSDYFVKSIDWSERFEIIDKIDEITNNKNKRRKKQKLRALVHEEFSELGEIIEIQIIDWDAEHDWIHNSCYVYIKIDPANPHQIEMFRED